MKAIQVKDLMVPLAEYATVSEDATLYEAFMALETALGRCDEGRYKHRAVLVLDKRGRIAGKLNQWDAIEGLEPRYRELRKPRDTSVLLQGADFTKSVVETYGLWQRPLDDICSKAVQIYVKDIMHVPAADEYVEEDASLDEAIHRLLTGRLLSLLVRRDESIIGILRLSDVFQEIYDRARACRV